MPSVAVLMEAACRWREMVVWVVRAMMVGGEACVGAIDEFLPMDAVLMRFLPRHCEL